MVATRHPAASRAGLEALRAGGTAVDAAVAAAFTLGVVAPSSTGVAGYGGCALVHLAAEGRTIAVDFNCRAPAAAREDMFPVSDDGAGTVTVAGQLNGVGGLGVAVPGIVAGLTYIQERFGTLPLPTVLQPAITAAREGFAVDNVTALMARTMLLPHADRYPDALRLFSIHGRLPEPGDTLTNPDLASTLERIGRDGPAVFYRGDLAGAIVEAVQRAGGILTRGDLASYQPTEAAPVRTDYQSATVLTPGLPAAGLTILQLLRVLEELGCEDRPGDADLAHRLIEVAKVCWRERLTRYGDPDVVPQDPDAELGGTRVRALRDRAAAGVASPDPGVIIAPDPLTGTAHLCAADRRGNVVSLTHTHGGSFGSLVSVPGTGLVLGHGMSRFEPRAGWPNSIGPGKRPLFNMAPLVVLREERPILAIGAAGGRTILSNLAHALARVLGRQETIDRAVAGVRFHVETAEPVQVERAGGALADALVRLGHRVEMRERFGSMQAIAVGAEPGRLAGVADPGLAGTVAWE